MNYLIVGASSGLGREIAYTFAKNSMDLILVSRDERDLLALKSDIELKYKVNIKTLICNFSQINEVEEKIINNLDIKKNLDGILLPIGLMFEKDNKDLNIKNIHQIINANFLSISFLVSKMFENLKEKNSSIVGFGSVSGLIGRNLNTNYAAAKRALESYFESLAFDTKNTQINIQFYMLGYLDTNLSFGKKLNLPKGKINKLSEIVFKNKNKKFLKTYYPFFWNFITFILKILPFTIVLKLKNFLK